jgi:hypothetical protein
MTPVRGRISVRSLSFLYLSDAPLKSSKSNPDKHWRRQTRALIAAAISDRGASATARPASCTTRGIP